MVGARVERIYIGSGDPYKCHFADKLSRILCVFVYIIVKSYVIGSVISCVGDCVCGLTVCLYREFKGKRLELSTPNLELGTNDMQSMAAPIIVC